jgi:uncharacterized protein YdaU (DUF1376 family)
MHFYQFHIGDYKSHTYHLSLIEDLAFRRLLDHYYLHELPIKQRDIARKIGLEDYEQEVLTVLDEFFVSTESGYIHPRADAEIAKFRKFSEDGKKGAAMRWSKGGDSPPIATPMATNNQEPITNNHKPNKTTSVVCPDGLDESLWKDFLVLRKAKKLPMTQTALNGIQAEGAILGWSLCQTITECINRGWGGFKASWIQKELLSNPADRIHVTVPGKQERDPALVKLDNDAKITAPPPTHILERFKQLRKEA